MKHFIRILLVITTIVFLASLSACSGSSGGGYRGHTNYGYGVGYDGYYGRGPWGYRPGYVGGGIGPGVEIDDGPVAEQMPDMGMPDMGGMDMDMGMGMDMDMGGFDDF
ncbi:MAG: hypothetical protein QNK22_02385 [Xanthomonadales bacterium]|nr:hypothetical protein [Xanthomonadales bacterium]